VIVYTTELTENTERILFFGLPGDTGKPKPICPGGLLLSKIYQRYTVGYKRIATKWLRVFVQSSSPDWTKEKISL
jgi:hypothetical protein